MMLDESQMDHSILAYRKGDLLDLYSSGMGQVAVCSGSDHRPGSQENVVGTFGILYGFAEVSENGSEMGSNLADTFTPAAALFLPGVQSAVRSLFCRYGRHQA